MFLKIVSKDPEKNEIRESVYECKTYHVQVNDEGIIFTLDDNLDVAINGKTTRTIYIMNNEGKTIERMYWKHK